MKRPVFSLSLSLSLSLSISVAGVALVLLIPSPARSQCPNGAFDHHGTEFWFVFPEALVSGDPGELVILSDVPQNVTVSAPHCVGTSLPPPAAPVPVDAGSPATIPICGETMITSSETLETDRFIRVTGSSPFVALFNYHLPAGPREETYLGLPLPPPFLVPSSAVGWRYRVVGHRGESPGPSSRWALVAVDDNVHLTYQDCNGALQNATLPSAGDIFQLRCPDWWQDTTGSLVESTGGRFLLIGGSVGVRLPEAWSCCDDPLLETIPSTGWYEALSVWRYWTAPLQRHPNAQYPWDWVRLVNLSDQAVTVRVRTSEFYQADGWARDYMEFPFPPGPPPVGSTHPCATSAPGGRPDAFVTLQPAGSSGAWCDLFIREAAMYESTDGPFAVTQYALGAEWKDDPPLKELGDPSQVLMVPEARWACRHRFWVRPGFDLPEEPDFPDGHGYVTVLADPNQQIRIDGGTEWQDSFPVHPAPTPDSSQRVFVYAIVTLEPGEHTVGENPLTGGWFDVPVLVYVHGYRYRGSYAYPTGMITQ